jgi:hypothetical protein
MSEVEALNRAELELRLRAEVEEARRRLRRATPEEQPEACRRLTDALHVFAHLLLEPRTTEERMRRG